MYYLYSTMQKKNSHRYPAADLCLCFHIYVKSRISYNIAIFTSFLDTYNLIYITLSLGSIETDSVIMKLCYKEVISSPEPKAHR